MPPADNVAPPPPPPHPPRRPPRPPLSSFSSSGPPSRPVPPPPISPPAHASKPAAPTNSSLMPMLAIGQLFMPPPGFCVFPALSLHPLPSDCNWTLSLCWKPRFSKDLALGGLYKHMLCHFTSRGILQTITVSGLLEATCRARLTAPRLWQWPC